MHKEAPGQHPTLDVGLVAGGSREPGMPRAGAGAWPAEKEGCCDSSTAHSLGWGGVGDASADTPMKLDGRGSPCQEPSGPGGRNRLCWC